MNGKIAEELNQIIPETRLVRNKINIAGRLVSRFNWISQDETSLVVKSISPI
jgi:hypothetical protein